MGQNVERALKGKTLAMKKTDISMRFCEDAPLNYQLVASCRLDCLEGGLATTRIEVRTGSKLVANGVSTTTCLKAK